MDGKRDNHSKEKMDKEETKLEEQKKRRKLVSGYQVGITVGKKRGRKKSKISEQERLAYLDEQLASMGENLEGLLKRVGSSEKCQKVVGREPPKLERKRRTKEELEKDKALKLEQDKRKEKDLAKAVQRVKGRLEARAKNSKELKTLEHESLPILFKRRKIGVSAEVGVVGGTKGNSASNSGGEQEKQLGKGGAREKRVNKVNVFISEKSQVDGILKEMEGGALVPVYPKRTMARPLPKERPRPTTKEIGIQASLSRAVVPWVPPPVKPSAVLPPPAPPMSTEMLMPPPPAPPLLPTSSSTALAIFRHTPPPPPTFGVFTTTREPRQPRLKEPVPVDLRRLAKPTPPQEANKEEDDDVVILEPNDPPAWKLHKIHFAPKQKKSPRSSSRTNFEHESSRRSRSSKKLSSSHKSSRHHKSRRKPHSSTRTSSKAERHRPVKMADRVIPIVMLSDSPSEPDQECDRYPSTPNSAEAIKSVRTKDVKGCTEIFDSSKRQWPEPVRDSWRHPIRIINCYHVIREKKLMPAVDLTTWSPPRERKTKEHEMGKSFRVFARGPKFPALLTAPPTPMATAPVFPPLPKEPPPVSPPPPPPPPPPSSPGPEPCASVPDSVLMPPPPPPHQRITQLSFRIRDLRTRPLSPPPASYFTRWD